MGAPGTTKDWEAKLGIEKELESSLDSEKQSRLSAADAAYGGYNEASYNQDEVIETAKNNLNMLAGIAMPTIFKFFFPKVLLIAWQLLVQSAVKERDFSQIALGIPRGHGKTTLIKLFVLYCILFTKKKFILVVGSKATNAENIVSDIIDMLNESNIIRLFGDWKLGIEINRQDLRKFGFRGRNITLAAIGSEGSLRGLNIKNERPDVMIFDDVQTAECAESQVQSDALERWMIGTAMKAKSPHGCLFIFAGNMFATSHSILKKLKTNPTWIKFISGAILADGTSLWPSLRPLEDLIAEFDNDVEMGHPEIFFAEVMNDTEVGINSRVDLSLLKAWPYSEHDLPQGKFIIIDPSSDKVGGDDVAIGYFEVFDAVPGMVQCIEEKLSPGNTIRQALLLALKTGTKVIGCEGTGYQSTLLYWFNEITTQLGITGLHFVEVYPGSKSKNSRISTMLKSLTASEILVHDSVRAKVVHQIVNWNPMKRDNVDGILDILTYSTKMLEDYGYLMATDADIEVQEATAAKVLANNTCF